MPFGFPAFMLPLLRSEPQPEPDDPELKRQIRGERIRMLFAPAVPVSVVSALVCMALAWAIADQTGRTWAMAWAGLCVLASAGRLMHLRAYRRSSQRDHPMWLQSLTLMCALHGCAWGLVGFLMPVDDMVTSSVLASTLVGACAVATFTLQAHLQPNLATNLPTLVPASLMLLSRQDAYGVFGGLGLLALMVVMLFESRRAERRITELLWLRFTTDRIARERAHALVLAQRHSAVKDQFLATMSHEMRTPLHGILGLARLLLDRLPERPGVLHESRHQVELIERAGEHLLHIINDVLDFSRIEAGKLQIQHAAFDLRGLIDDIVELQRVTAQEKGLRLLADVRLPQPCWVSGDASRLRQMLHNLLGNAIKFTEVGEIRLRVGTSSYDPGSVIIHVQDTGIGIAADQLPLIFEAFHQVDGSFMRRHKGTGLGLTITREIARAMGGDIECTSEVGKGSVFTLQVPLRPTAPPETIGPAGVAPLGTQPSASTGSGALAALARFSGHVLLVEDNPVNALVAEANLTRLGLSVTRAENGQQALSLLLHPTRAFDLVLMDLQMPELDGMAATRRLRQWESEHRLRPLPVVALTANALSTDRARCLSAGMDDHLPKPFRAEELVAVLQRHLPAVTEGVPA
jgi:signal transduction histidine kinase/ActR/RegA family two-component response regulator